MASLILSSPESFVKSPSQPQSRNRFTISDKVRILNELNASGGWVRRTAKANGLHHSVLQRWKKDEESLVKLAGTKGCLARRVSNEVTTYRFGKEVEQELLAFVEKRREQSFHVTPKMLVTEWMRIHPESVSALSTAAARARIYRFMRRNSLVFRRTTHKAQVTRTNPVVIEDFVSYCNWKAELLGIAPDCIANFDETNVYFSPPIHTTIAKKGSKTVSIRQPDSSNRCTAMLGVSMTGYKLPPFIIFKGKMTQTARVRRELLNAAANHYPSGLIYKCQKQAWMDEATMLEWVETVWRPFTAKKNGAPTLLMIDWAPSHVGFAVKNRIASCNTELEFIPKGYTSKCQVLDVGINKPFADYIREQVDRWQLRNAFDKKPSRQDVSHWIRMSWMEIRESTIINTWRHIGFKANGSGSDQVCGEGTVDDDVSVNDETNLDPLAYNTCDEISDSETEDEDEFAVR